MNFKLLWIFIFLTGCGVKGDPVSPQATSVPSVLENYPEIKTKQPLNETKNK